MEALKKAREVRMANIAARREQAVQMPVDVPPLPKAAPAAPKPQPPQEFARKTVAKAADPLLGITSEDCCIDCNMDRCVISGKPYCAHPRKCGLAPVDKVNPEIMNRYNRARKVLIHADIDRQP